MKNILPLFIVVYLLALCSCQHRQSYPPQFLVADSLASVQPDSALALLESLKADSLQWDKATQMYHSLLTIKARDKAYISHTSDSLMLQVLSYYEHEGDKRLLPEAYYYMGSTYRDMNDAPRALEYYQKALEVLPEGASPLRRYVNNQMGFLFYRQNLYDEALSCYQSSYLNDSILEEKTEMSSDLVNMGFIYGSRNMFDMSLDYYLRARTLLTEGSDSLAMDEIDCQIANLYCEIGDVKKAKTYIQLPLKHVNRSNISNIYSIAGIIYYKLGVIDSASYYFNELLHVGNIYGKQSAYEHLAIINAEKHHDNEETFYLNQYLIFRDSVKSITATESIAQMASLYNYQKAIEEREAITIRNNTNRWIILILVLSLITIALGVLKYVSQVRQARLAMQNKMEELEQAQQTMKRIAELSIEQKKDYAKELESQLDCPTDSEPVQSDLLKEMHSLLLSQIADAEEIQRHREEIDAKLKESEMHARVIYLINKQKERLSYKDFVKLKNTYYDLAPDFMNRLMCKSVYSDIELQILLLSRMGVSPKDVAFLTNYSKSNLSNIRSRLYRKISGEAGGAKNLDEYIYML